MIRHKQITKLKPEFVEKKLQEFFNEDNISEDITTNTVIDFKKEAKGLFIAEFSGVFCGINIIESGFSKNVKIVNGLVGKLMVAKTKFWQISKKVVKLMYNLNFEPLSLVEIFICGAFLC